MKKFYVIFTILGLVSACAHTDSRSEGQTGDKNADNNVEIHGTVDGVHINAVGFLKLTAQDLQALAISIKSATENDLELSDGQKSRCLNGVCHLVTKSFEGEFNTTDLDKFGATLNKAQKTNKEARLVDGPVTLRCLPTQCVTDFHLDDNQKRKFSGQAHLQEGTDVPGYLLSGFVAGMIGAAHGANR